MSTPTAATNSHSAVHHAVQAMGRGDISQAVDTIWYDPGLSWSEKLPIQTELMQIFKAAFKEATDKYSSEIKESQAKHQLFTEDRPLIKIFEFIDNGKPKTRIKFAAVCKRFEQIAFKALRQAPPTDATSVSFTQLTRIQNDNHYEKVRILRSTKSFHGGGLTNTKFEKITRHHFLLCSGIRHLSFSNCDRISNKSIQIIASTFTLLKSIRFPTDRKFEDPHFHEAFLEYSSIGLPQFGLKIHSITKLAIQFIQMISKGGKSRLTVYNNALEVVATLPDIKHFTFIGAPQVWDGKYIDFIRLNPQIQTLKIEDNPHCNKDGLRQIAGVVPSLTSLTLKNCQYIGYKAIGAFYGLPRLRVLDLTDCFVNDRILTRLSKYCTNLTDLVLANNHPDRTYPYEVVRNPFIPFGDAGLISIAQVNKRTLSIIDLKNSRITETGLNYLRQNCQMLGLYRNIQSCSLIPPEKRIAEAPEFHVTVRGYH